MTVINKTKYLIVVIVITFFFINITNINKIYAQDAIGYEYFKLGMPFSEINKIYNSHYKSEWKYSYLSDNYDDGIQIISGFYFTHFSGTKKILLNLTSGIYGSISTITILEEFSEAHSTMEKFNIIKSIINRKYGKPGKDSLKSSKIRIVDWRIDPNRYISLTAQFDQSDNIYGIILIYGDVKLQKIAHSYYEKEINRLRDERFKKESERY